jgi:hypothetical protein
LATVSFPPQMLLTSIKQAILMVPLRSEQKQEHLLTLIAILQKEIT